VGELVKPVGLIPLSVLVQIQVSAKKCYIIDFIIV
jgi:hypothetical protein